MINEFLLSKDGAQSYAGRKKNFLPHRIFSGVIQQQRLRDENDASLTRETNKKKFKHTNK